MLLNSRLCGITILRRSLDNLPLKKIAVMFQTYAAFGFGRILITGPSVADWMFSAAAYFRYDSVMAACAASSFTKQ
jgi:hypothetical protein